MGNIKKFIKRFYKWFCLDERNEFEKLYLEYGDDTLTPVAHEWWFENVWKKYELD